MSSKTQQAVQLVLAGGLTQNQAAKQAGVDPAAVSRALKKHTTVKVCPCCGAHSKERVDEIKGA